MQNVGIKKNLSLRKALEILEAMSSMTQPVRLYDIAAQVGLPQSTVLRFLNTYIDYGYVMREQNSGMYYLTLKLARIGNQSRANYPFQQALQKYVRQAAQHFRESASLCVESDMQMVYIYIEEGPEHLLQTLTRIGRVAPMHATAVGKLHLLNYTQAQLETLVNTRGLPRLTDRTITDLASLQSELESVRALGYALDDEECETGVRCIAVPVRDDSLRVVAGISISAPVSRLEHNKIGEAVSFLAALGNAASAEMGYPLTNTPGIPPQSASCAAAR